MGGEGASGRWVGEVGLFVQEGKGRCGGGWLATETWGGPSKHLKMLTRVDCLPPHLTDCMFDWL